MEFLSRRERREAADPSSKFLGADPTVKTDRDGHRKPTNWVIPFIVTFLPLALAYGVNLAVVSMMKLSYSDYLNVYEYISVLVYAILFISVVLLLKKEGSSLSSVVNFQPRKLPLDIGIGLLIVAVAVFIINPIYASAWSLIQPVPQITYFGNQPPPAWFLIILLPGITAITEELVWRGYSISRFNMLTKNSLAAILISSLGFAIWHHTLYLGGYELITGFMLGVVYTKTGRLTAPIAGHWIYDSFAFYLLLFG